MEIRELVWFTTLAETQHVTLASERLNVSQPTLSRALARLERRLGVRLFDRRQNRLHLNKYGEIFRAHALRAANDMSLAEDRIRSLVDPESGLISLGFLHSFGGWLVPGLMSGYLAEVPRARFDLRGAAADTVVDDVRHGRADVGLVGPQPVADDVAWFALGREDLCLSVPRNHQLARRKSVRIEELAAEPFVVLQPSYGLRQVGDRLCHRAGFQPNIVCETTELTTVIALIAAGIGIALTTTNQTHTSGQDAVAEVPIEDVDAFREYGLVSRPGGPTGQAAQRFLEFAKSSRYASDA
ncbi:LysR family transcriptional regulator [Nocardioides sp. NPDC087217]|uniref:LysR family transcriptional regulator n=1 Tax=Nocardioides sp. NPDC087217 TaxID=3364335 RepID=UPI0037F5A2A4